MKKYIITGISIVVLIIITYMIVTGFNKVGSIYISEYIASNDNKKMTVTMQNASSIGFIRKIETKYVDNKVYLTSISAFGGINGSIMAKDKYDIELKDNTEEIYLFKAKDNYSLVLKKDNEGTWVREKN